MKAEEIIQKTIAILLVLDGGYYLLGVLATLIIRHVLFLDFRCFLVLLGIRLWTNQRYAKGVAIAYLVFVLFGKSDIWVLAPDTTNIFYVLGLVSIRQYSEQTLHYVNTIATCYRATQILLLLWITKSGINGNMDRA